MLAFAKGEISTFGCTWATLFKIVPLSWSWTTNQNGPTFMWDFPLQTLIAREQILCIKNVWEDGATLVPKWEGTVVSTWQWKFPNEHRWFSLHINDHSMIINAQFVAHKLCRSGISPAMLRPRSRICSRTLSAGPLRSSWPWRCQTCTSLPPGATTLWVLKGEPMHQEKVETVWNGGLFFWRRHAGNCWDI